MGGAAGQRIGRSGEIQNHGAKVDGHGAVGGPIAGLQMKVVRPFGQRCTVDQMRVRSMCQIQDVVWQPVRALVENEGVAFDPHASEVVASSLPSDRDHGIVRVGIDGVARARDERRQRCAQVAREDSDGVVEIACDVDALVVRADRQVQRSAQAVDSCFTIEPRFDEAQAAVEGIAGEGRDRVLVEARGVQILAVRAESQGRHDR